MQLVTLILITGALWVLFGQGELELKILPWRWIVLWSVLGGATNAEVSLMFSQQQGARLGSYIFTILILALVTAAGVKLSTQNGTPSFSTMQSKSPVEVLYAIVSGIVLAGLVLSSQLVGGGFNEAYESLIHVIRSSPQPWWTIILTSFQAGVMEEILYRFFALNLVLSLLRRSAPQILPKADLWISAIVTAVLFGLIPTHTLLLSIIVGLLLAMLYMRKGLGHVVIAHIIGDIILLSWNVFLRY